MDLETFIVTVFVQVDELYHAWLGGRRLRRRGPEPRLHDTEVLTMEIVGEFLGIDQERALVAYFQQHHVHLFPVIAQIHRTTFTRQASNLWRAKEALWERVVALVPHDPALALIDSVPAPVCRRAHAPRCQRFRGEAAFGWDASSRCFYYGLRHHLRVSWPGIVTAISVAPANVHDQDLVPEIVAGMTGIVIADRNYWNPRLTTDLARANIVLLAPYKKRSQDPTPATSRLLNTIRRRIETTASQLAERFHFKRIWARDAWHLTNRMLRKVLSHTLAVAINIQHGATDQPLRLERLLS